MAKELPYYQFEVAEYLAGDIMICSLEAQGLFSVIKCIYWQKECSLNLRQVLRRYDKKELINELVEEGVIKVDDEENISISFLDELYNTFKERRDKLSKAGRKGGLSKKEATLKPPLSHDKPTIKHIEENREEENREEEIKLIKPEKEFSVAVNQVYDETIKFFPNTTIPSSLKEVDSWKDTIRLLIEVEKLEPQAIIYLVKTIREDEFWAKNFLSIKKLRKKNNQGVKYCFYFAEIVKSKLKNDKSFKADLVAQQTIELMRQNNEQSTTETDTGDKPL